MLFEKKVWLSTGTTYGMFWQVHVRLTLLQWCYNIWTISCDSDDVLVIAVIFLLLSFTDIGHNSVGLYHEQLLFMTLGHFLGRYALRQEQGLGAGRASFKGWTWYLLLQIFPRDSVGLAFCHCFCHCACLNLSHPRLMTMVLVMVVFFCVFFFSFFFSSFFPFCFGLSRNVNSH